MWDHIWIPPVCDEQSWSLNQKFVLKYHFPSITPNSPFTTSAWEHHEINSAGKKGTQNDRTSSKEVKLRVRKYTSTNDGTPNKSNLRSSKCISIYRLQRLRSEHERHEIPIRPFQPTSPKIRRIQPYRSASKKNMICIESESLGPW